MTTLAPSVRKAYKPSIATQSNKLANRESDWNLRGTTNITLATRTRGGGHGRPDFTSRKKMFMEPVSESSDEESIEDEEDIEIDGLEALEEAGTGALDEETEVLEGTKPTFTRAIIDVASMMETLNLHCRCPECNAPLVTEVKVLCIATKFQLTCPSSRCGYIHYSKPPVEANIRNAGAPSRERSTDYAINVLWVLGFISVGDGCTEAARLLGLLGLPNDTTMESRSFTIIEERIGPYIARLTADILQERNLTEEVRRTVKQPNDFELWKQAQQGLLVLDRDKYPTLRASYDMAWQQRNSGNKYSSASGHALYMGGVTRKPISLAIKSKLCNVCAAVHGRRRTRTRKMMQVPCTFAIPSV